MQSEIDDIRTAVSAISRIYAKGLMTPDNFQAFTAQVLTDLRLIELQQAECRPPTAAPAFVTSDRGDIVRLRVTNLAEIAAEARRKNHYRFSVIEGEKA